MRPIEKNPRFTNPLVNSGSLYLRQHAHNPVFWYPWGREAIERAKTENKPIFLSIGYSTCYWCHVMEREVFQNLSIASAMNQTMINIKVDREERPDLDEIYMVARQLMTHEGGWPNNLFLTPDLKPFYGGGSFAPDESHGRIAFPRLLEWINYSWSTQEFEVRGMAQQITDAMKPHLVFDPPPYMDTSINIPKQTGELFEMLRKFHDGRSGGFFQAPKFPQECLLNFLLAYYEHTNSNDANAEKSGEALDMVTKSLQKMAAGGIYDHVGAGFHRYAVDKDWLVPHFEKMLYNQAMLARVYTDAARFTGNAYFADIAKSVLDFVRGPFTDASGAFYSAIDAEVDEVEGAFYAWKAEELESILTPDENGFLINFFALADIPHFPGHKANDGQVMIARQPLDDAARKFNVPYVQIAAMTGQLMNKLLSVRNLRMAPALDNKIIVGWNGLMIDAFAHAGKVFNYPAYLLAARRAADFLLEHAIDDNGNLKRIYASGQGQLAATLEDYAYLIKGILTLWKATPDDVLLEAARNLTASVDTLFGGENEEGGEGYYYSQPSDRLIIRSRNCDDMVIPNANGVMMHNFIDLYEITGEEYFRTKAQGVCRFFLGGNPKINIEAATILHAAMRLEAVQNGKQLDKPVLFDTATVATGSQNAGEDMVSVRAEMTPADAKPGDNCEVAVHFDIKEGWHINPEKVVHSFLIPLQLDIQGVNVEDFHFHFPKPQMVQNNSNDGPMPVLRGTFTIIGHMKLNEEERAPIRLLVRYQPCNESTCYKTQDISIAL